MSMNESPVLPELDAVPLEQLLEQHGLGVAPVWREARWQWSAYVARLNEPTDWSFADSPRAAVYLAIAALGTVSEK